MQELFESKYFLLYIVIGAIVSFTIIGSMIKYIYKFGENEEVASYVKPILVLTMGFPLTIMIFILTVICNLVETRAQNKINKNVSKQKKSSEKGAIRKVQIRPGNYKISGK